MTSEHRPRQHPIMNPEAAAAVLRQLVAGWDGDDQDAFVRALAEARRLLGASAPRQEPDEKAWLVELGCQPPQWWTGRPKTGRHWSDKSTDAMRFGRREDAEGAIGHLMEAGVAQGCKATEHIWMASAPRPGEATTPKSNICAAHRVDWCEVCLTDEAFSSGEATTPCPICDRPLLDTKGRATACALGHCPNLTSAEARLETLSAPPRPEPVSPLGALYSEDELELNRLAEGAASRSPETDITNHHGKFRDRLMHAASAWHEGVLDQWALLHQFDLVIDDIATPAAPAPTDEQQ